MLMRTRKAPRAICSSRNSGKTYEFTLGRTPLRQQRLPLQLAKPIRSAVSIKTMNVMNSLWTNLLILLLRGFTRRRAGHHRLFCSCYTHESFIWTCHDERAIRAQLAVTIHVHNDCSLVRKARSVRKVRVFSPPCH